MHQYQQLQLGTNRVGGDWAQVIGGSEFLSFIFTFHRGPPQLHSSSENASPFIPLAAPCTPLFCAKWTSTHISPPFILSRRGRCDTASKADFLFSLKLIFYKWSQKMLSNIRRHILNLLFIFHEQHTTMFISGDHLLTCKLDAFFWDSCVYILQILFICSCFWSIQYTCTCYCVTCSVKNVPLLLVVKKYWTVAELADNIFLHSVF